MVNTQAQPAKESITVSLTRAAQDRPQRVSVSINGFEYPGEVIFADQWQSWFGSSLPERVMFRIVLLMSSHGIDTAEVQAGFVAVAVTAGDEPVQPSSEYVQMDREIGRLNEIREQYVTAADYELRSLSASLAGHTAEAQRNIAETLAARWRNGTVLLSMNGQVNTVRADSIFVGDDPAAWIEATAATMFARPTTTIKEEVHGFDPETLFKHVTDGRDADWRRQLDHRISLACGTNMPSLFRDIDGLAGTNSSARIPGSEVRRILFRQYGLPPGLASLTVAAYVSLRDGESEVSASDGNFRLDRHSMPGTEFHPDLVHNVNWISQRHSGDWNSALSYVRALLPNAEASTSGNPSLETSSQLSQVLSVMASRTTLTLHVLKSVSGPVIERLTEVALAKRLANVLDSEDWRVFYNRARAEFSSTAEFDAAVRSASHLRALSEDIVDVQAANHYLSSADFGRMDNSLASEAALLLKTVDAAAILENRSSAMVELERFNSWKRNFTRAYLEHHAARRSADLELSRRVKRANLQHEAIRKLSAIPELEGIYEPGFAARWSELKKRVSPCPNSENEVQLTGQPYCPQCGIRLGSQGYEDEVEGMIAEIENMLRDSSTRLSAIAASRALSGHRETDLRTLIDINSIADLTALSHVLDDDVLTFLKHFADESESAG